MGVGVGKEVLNCSTVTPSSFLPSFLEWTELPPAFGIGFGVDCEPYQQQHHQQLPPSLPCLLNWEMDPPVPRASGEAEKRQLILEIHRNGSLSAEEKARLIQNLHTPNLVPNQSLFMPSPADIAVPGPTDDHTPRYQDQAREIMGCPHYQCKCLVRAECCRMWVSCRLCHDDQVKDHAFNRYDTKFMTCMLCWTSQPVSQTCSNPACAAQVPPPLSPSLAFAEECTD